MVNEFILHGDKILLPDAPEHPGNVYIRTKILDIAHEIHPGENAMKRYVRSRLWFSGMYKQIAIILQGCLACRDATAKKHRDRLKPSTPPEKQWKNLSAEPLGTKGRWMMISSSCR